MTVVINGTTGITAPEVAVDNGSADGGQVVLKSTGFNNWNIDNYNGSLRSYYGSTVATSIDSSANFQFNSGYGSVATAYGCRAWVNFNGTGTVAIRASGNVSSITDQGVGRYKVNLATAMPDTNYVTVGSVLNSTTPSVNGIAWVGGSDDSGATIGSYTTTAFQIGTYYYPTTIFDPQYVQVALFR